ncbi:MAG: asparagine synthase (glutamine-hydrolyzing) [Proteobacteria bacterium]|nr:asparagine synthase (glutamine-hydrolyzing) [Pseudomonadota bacterium]
MALADVVAMRDTLQHRGPDDCGVYVDDAVGLGHRRLSIIDLASGKQPITNEDGSIVIVFNGEIYNFQELRAELIARGHTLRTRSDTEVIVHLYEELGEGCLQRLRGMFAFALWDSRQRRLLLARDRVGEKPLYYGEFSGQLLFASEIKAILGHASVPREVDPVGLRRFLSYRHAYGHGTLFRGVRQVPPGHMLVAQDGRFAIRPYWDVPQRGSGGVDPADAQAFLPLLEESVSERLISDVPVGVFLSGGLDSSVVTALMARHASSVSTFSIGFVPGEENELAWAHKVADACRAQHHEFTQGAEDFYAMLRRLVWHHDEPLTFPASIPLYLLSRESKRVATVMLAGEGADELLGGYGNNIRSHELARWRRLAPPSLWRMVARLPLPRRLAGAAGRIAENDAEFIASAFRLPDHARLRIASRIQLPDGAGDDDRLFDEVGLTRRSGTFLDRLLYFQFKTYLIALLMKQDKMSMAASIETRVPFLDHRLVELAFRLPDDQKIRRGVGKLVLREQAAGLLPPSILTRPKMGFPVPIARWFRAPDNPFLALLLDAETRRDGLLEPAYVSERITAFQNGAPIQNEIWAILNLEIWRREFLAAGARARAVPNLSASDALANAG